jgi:hypothetical protein
MVFYRFDSTGQNGLISPDGVADQHYRDAVGSLSHNYPQVFEGLKQPVIAI